MDNECHGPCLQNNKKCPTPYLCEIPEEAEENTDKLIRRRIVLLICIWSLATISLLALISKS
jgi:hypothetical protein